MKRRLFYPLFIIFLFILPEVPFANFSVYINNGILRPIGKVNGVGFTSISPYETDATQFYLESYNIGIGMGFTPFSRFGNQMRITMEMNISPVMRLTETGQIVSDAAAGFEVETSMMMVDINANLLYSLFNPHRFRVIPFGGGGFRHTKMSISAEGYGSESESLNSLQAFAGLDVRLGKLQEKGINKFLQFEIRYMPNLSTSHIPSFIRFNVGLNILF